MTTRVYIPNLRGLGSKTIEPGIMRRNVPALAVSRASISNSRRLALLGAFAGSAVVLRLLGYQASKDSFVVYGLWIVAALLYRALLTRVRRPATANTLQAVAYCADISFLTAMYTVIGGGWWYGAVFHAFIVTFAFASLPRRQATIVTSYAVAAFIALIGGEAFGVIATGNYLGLPSIAGNYGFAATAGMLGVGIIVGSAVVQHTFVRIMRRSQERYRLLLQTAPDFIATIDRAHVIRAANESAQLFVATHGVDAVGQELGRFVHPDDRPALIDCMESAWGGQSRQLELRLLPGDPNGDDGERWMIGTFNPLREEGRITALLFVARDITQRKRDEEALRRSQEELRQSQKLEAVGRLAGGVAHDFNNVLTLISAYSEFLIQGVETGTARRDDVQEIRDAAARASALTNQLLAFSRKQVMQPRMVSLNSVVQGMEKMLGRLLATNITIETKLDSGLELVHADPGQLEQVLLNLCVNARDAMPRGGVLTIETRNVAVADVPVAAPPHGTRIPATYVALTVRDTGEGMDEETRSRVFEPFFTTKPTGQGTGLGLSTAYGIVAQSGGNVTVASERGSGSSFTIFLPAAEVGDDLPPELDAATPREAPHGTETVLVVEDGGALREAIVRILAQNGYTVLSATDGEDGMAVASSHDGPIHLLLTDVVMPVFGGRELARRFIDSRPEARVLFMSGYMAEEVLRDGLRPPVVGFLAKPFRPDQLAWKVRDVLDARASPTARDVHRAPPPDGALSVGQRRDGLPV
ncbi:MAG TPA: ATP-binding protein [Gemmatimonadaceae bacterium]